MAEYVQVLTTVDSEEEEGEEGIELGYIGPDGEEVVQ